MEGRINALRRRARNTLRSWRDENPLPGRDTGFLRPQALERASLGGETATAPREDRFLGDRAGRAVNAILARPGLRRTVGWLWFALIIGFRIVHVPIPGYSHLSSAWKWVAFVGLLAVFWLVIEWLARAAAADRKRSQN
jgi:hypothetical protein